MSDDVKATIGGLNERELRQVASALTGRLRSRVRAQYKDRPETLKELESREDAPAIVAAAGGVDLAALQGVPLDALRQLMIRLADEPELRDEVRHALDHRLTASIAGLDVAAVSALIVFVLSIKFEIDVKKTKSGWDVRFNAAKKATPVDLLKSLVNPLLAMIGKSGKG